MAGADAPFWAMPLNPESSRRRPMPWSEEWQRVYRGAPEIILHDPKQREPQK